MPVTRNLTNGNRMVDWSEEILEVPNQYGLLNGMGLFSGEGVATESIVFDRTEKGITLLKQSDRRGDGPTKSKTGKSETFALALPYFNHTDRIVGADVQGRREVGTPDQLASIAKHIADKMEDMRLVADQTNEYMKIQAIKGITKDPEGNTLADMFTQFGMTRADYTVDFKLGTASTDVGLKIADLKRKVAKNAMSGGALGRIEVMCSPEFFDKLISHASIEEAFKYYAARVSPQRDDLQTFMKWGVMDTFEYKGVLFYSYDAEFVLPSGSTERAISDTPATEGGYTIVTGMPKLYRAAYGPANTLSGANKPGQEMFFYEYPDPRDKFVELELEMAPLYWMTKPQMSWKVVSSD